LRCTKNTSQSAGVPAQHRLWVSLQASAQAHRSSLCCCSSFVVFLLLVAPQRGSSVEVWGFGTFNGNSRLFCAHHAVPSVLGLCFWVSMPAASALDLWGQDGALPRRCHSYKSRGFSSATACAGKAAGSHLH